MDGFNPEISFQNAELYLEEFYKHLERGDDRMNAKLRIIEQGCPPDVADQIDAAAYGETEHDKEHGLLCACKKVRVPWNTRELLIGTMLHSYAHCRQVKS